MGKMHAETEIDELQRQSQAGTGDREVRDSYGLLPRARFRDVVVRKAPVVGARVSAGRPRGWVSPVEARVYLGIPYGDMAVEEQRLLDNQSMGSRLAVLMRSMIARVMAPRSGLRTLRRPRVVSAHVDNITIDEALTAMTETHNGSQARIVYIVHPHALNLAAFNSDFARQLTLADLVLPDGIGIRIAGSLLGISLRHNLNGTDMLPLLCKAAAEKGLPMVLIGGEPGVAEQCARNLMRDTPGLRIVYFHHGYLDDMSSKEVAAHVKTIGRCLVLVGMGSPLQERWAWQHLKDASNTTVVTVGGLFDFFSGRIPRAPVAWRELGIEWLWRLRMEPRRLAKRYLIGNPLFIMITLWQRIRGTT